MKGINAWLFHIFHWKLYFFRQFHVFPKEVLLAFSLHEGSAKSKIEMARVAAPLTSDDIAKGHTKKNSDIGKLLDHNETILYDWMNTQHTCHIRDVEEEVMLWSHSILTCMYISSAYSVLYFIT